MLDTQAPKLEMLWETSDPHTALVERFHFEDGISAARWVAALLNERWGIPITSCERIVISDHNALAWVSTPSGQMLAKWSVVPGKFPRLIPIAHLTHWLDGKGLPVSSPTRTLTGDLQVEVDGALMCVQRVIQGGLLDIKDPQQVEAAGAVLARLHQALAAYPDADQLVLQSGRPKSLTERVTGWLDSEGKHVSRGARDTLRRLVRDAPPDRRPTQLVHGDFRSSNLLCAGTEIAAVIDFEEVRTDHCIDELTRSAVLLGTQFRDWGPVSAEVHAVFLKGYQSVRPLTPAEADWWNILVLWYSLAFVPAGDDPTGWGASARAVLEALAP